MGIFFIFFFFSVKSPLNGRVNLKFGCTVLWQHCNTQVSGLLFFGYLLLALEAEKQDYIQLLSTRQSCWLTHTVAVWDRCNLRLNINMLVIPDATSQRTCSPNKVNISWLKCWPCSCRTAVFLFNFPFLRIYISFRMCRLFFHLKLLMIPVPWFETLLTSTDSAISLLFLHPYLAWSNSLHALSLSKWWLQHNIIFTLLKLGYYLAISPHIYENNKFLKKYRKHTINSNIL